MDYESILTGSRWEMLKSLTEGPKTATEIAESINTSLPNVSQQIKLLEAYGIVEHRKKPREKPGKPKKKYRIKEKIAHITMIANGCGEKKKVTPDTEEEAILRTFFLEEHGRPLRKFIVNHGEILEKAESIVVSNIEDKKIDLLFIGRTEKVEEIREEKNKIVLEEKTEEESGRKQKEIVIWSHTEEEIKKGLAEGEEHFENLLKDSTVIMDKKATVNRLRNSD